VLEFHESAISTHSEVPKKRLKVDAAATWLEASRVVGDLHDLDRIPRRFELGDRVVVMACT
jgi:hypothetical protein